MTSHSSNMSSLTTALKDLRVQDQDMEYLTSASEMGETASLTEWSLTPLERAIPDVMEMVFDYLEPEDIMSLALTSRTMFRVHWERGTRRPVSTRYTGSTRHTEQLLLRLERDLPDRFYCHGCVKLHRWNPAWYDVYKGTEPDLCNNFNKDMIPCPNTNPFTIPGSYALPYHFVRPVMNRIRYGPKHGPPLRVLNRSTREVIKGTRLYGDRHCHITKAGEHKVKIVDGKLILESQVSAHENKGNLPKLLRCLQRMGICVCQHLVTHPVHLGIKPDIVADPILSPANACYLCMTDYTVQLSKTSPLGGWQFTVNSWQCLGSTLSPMNWDWKHMTMVDQDFRRGFIEPRFRVGREDLTLDPGMIMLAAWRVPLKERFPDAEYRPADGLELLEVSAPYYGHTPIPQASPYAAPAHTDVNLLLG